MADTPTPDDLLAEAAQYKNDRGFDADLIRRLAAEVERLRAERQSPTAGQVAAHLRAGGTVQQWHPWRDGGGWGLPHSYTDTVWETMPADEPQPGFRLVPGPEKTGE